MATMSKREWKRRRRRKRMIKHYSMLAGFALMVLLVLILLIKLITHLITGNDGIIKKAGKIEVEKKLLTVDSNTRSGQELETVKGIVIHNTGEVGVSAEDMWSYYEALATSDDTSESMHFIVDTDGSILQCIPCNEIAFHALSRNNSDIGIQYCYTSESGVMSDKTYNAMVELVAELCDEYKLTTADISLHYDITGRLCPAYYVENSDEWQSFLDDVSKKIR